MYKGTQNKKNNITELTVLGKYCTKVMVRNCACSTIVLLHVCVYTYKKKIEYFKFPAYYISTVMFFKKQFIIHVRVRKSYKFFRF